MVKIFNDKKGEIFNISDLVFCFSGSGSFVEQWFCRNVE